MPKLNCKCCNQMYDAHLMVTCCICKNKFKHTCVDITANEVRTLNSNKGYDWTCVNCRTIGQDIKQLKSLILDLQKEIKQLRADKIQPGLNSGFDIEEIVSEISDRQRRSKNIIIYNVKEQDQQNSANDRIQKDNEQVVSILSAVLPELSVAHIRPIRLGTFATNKTRPIKIMLESDNCVGKVLRNANKLKANQRYKHINISSDKTKKQIEFYNTLKSELKQRSDAGEMNLRIKYVNKIPRIVSEN